MHFLEGKACQEMSAPADGHSDHPGTPTANGFDPEHFTANGISAPSLADGGFYSELSSLPLRGVNDQWESFFTPAAPGRSQLVRPGHSQRAAVLGCRGKPQRAAANEGRETRARDAAIEAEERGWMVVLGTSCQSEAAPQEHALGPKEVAGGGVFVGQGREREPKQRGIGARDSGNIGTIPSFATDAWPGLWKIT